jgi:hypothetical protein
MSERLLRSVGEGITKDKHGGIYGQETGFPPSASVLLTSLAFYGETNHTKTNITRNGAGSLAGATCAK